MPTVSRTARSLASGVLASALLLAPTRTRADDAATFADRSDDEVRDAERRIAFLLNPLSMAGGFFGGEADFVLGRYAAIAIEADLYRRADATGEALGAGLLVYPLGGALHRLYFEPRVAYARPSSEEIAKIDWSKDVVGLGGTAGWQWTWDYGFSLRLGGGAMYFLGEPRSGAPRELLAVGPQPVFDGALGWAF